MGAPYQYTSDVTERCHCMYCKRPFQSSNKKDFLEQCCQYMDCNKKLNNFGLYTSLVSNGASLVNEMFLEAQEIRSHYPEAIWLSHALPKGDRRIPGKLVMSSLFDKARSHIDRKSVV